MDAGVLDVELAGIDAVEAEYRQDGRKGSCRTALYLIEHLVDAQLVGEYAVALAPPVVEIAGDDQRRILRDRGANALGKRPYLPLPASLEQAKVDVDAMQVLRAAGELDLAMQQPAVLEHVRRNVLVLLRDDRKARQDGVAVMPLAIDGVAAIGHLLPHGVRDEFVLRLARPVDVAAGVAVVGALHLLQEQDVDGQPVQLLLDLMDDHAPGQVREALVDIERRDGEIHRGGGRRLVVTAAMLAGNGVPLAQDECGRPCRRAVHACVTLAT